MPMEKHDIIHLIHQAFPDAEIDLQDLRGDKDHYALTVASKDFLGKSRVQQHQMVYKALGSHMGTTLHAMALVTQVKE